LASRVQKSPAFNNTVNRITADVAVSKILGNPKIPLPSFETPPSPGSVGAQLDINFAKNLLQSAGALGTSVTNAIGQGQQTIASINASVNTAVGTFNRLIG